MVEFTGLQERQDLQVFLLQDCRRDRIYRFFLLQDCRMDRVYRENAMTWCFLLSAFCFILFSVEFLIFNS
jgi:hypothetical protein